MRKFIDIIVESEKKAWPNKHEYFGPKVREGYGEATYSLSVNDKHGTPMILDTTFSTNGTVRHSLRPEGYDPLDAESHWTNDQLIKRIHPDYQKVDSMGRSLARGLKMNDAEKMKAFSVYG